MNPSKGYWMNKYPCIIFCKICLRKFLSHGVGATCYQKVEALNLHWSLFQALTTYHHGTIMILILFLFSLCPVSLLSIYFSHSPNCPYFRPLFSLLSLSLASSSRNFAALNLLAPLTIFLFCLFPIPELTILSLMTAHSPQSYILT